MTLPVVVQQRDGSRRWLLDGKPHRHDGPAVEWSNGTKEWWRRGKRHRDHGPAIEGADGYRAWYRHGKARRLNAGPTMEWPNGDAAWHWTLFAEVHEVGPGLWEGVAPNNRSDFR